jgi:hypothetical protein
MVICEDQVLPNGKVRRTYINPDTGEIENQGIHGFRPDAAKPHKAENPPFAKLWMPNLLKLIRNKSLSQGEKALVFDLIVFLDWQGTMLVHPEKGYAVNTRDIAEYLSLSLGFVSETMTSLHDKGVIGKFSAGKGRPHRYHLNCNIAFYGKNMNDIRDYERFNMDCSYVPVQAIEYKQEDKGIRKIRRDIELGMTPIDKRGDR